MSLSTEVGEFKGAKVGVLEVRLGENLLIKLSHWIACATTIWTDETLSK